MNRELKVLFDDDKSIVLMWEKSKDSSCEYVVVGKDENFNDIRILTTKDTKLTLDKKDIKKYISITIEYIIKYDNKEVVIDRTNTIDIDNTMYKYLQVKAIKSYKNITLLIESQDIYDKYYIYEKDNDNYNLIIESEDFIINSDKFKKNKTYKIEAYKKVEEEYKLFAIRDNYKIEEFYKRGKRERVDISIIIPVYNCELYVARCLDSILLSTFNNIEIIAVNDGSTDNSLKILEYYKDKYSSIIRIVDKENGGPASARNEGIKYIKGEYTAFFDSDDFIHPYMLEKCYEVAKKTNADVVTSKVIYRDFGKNDRWFELNEGTTDKRYTVQDYHSMMYHKYHDVEHNIYLVTLWNRIMKSKFIKEHPIPDLAYYEDAAYTRLIYSYLDTFALSLDSYYVWDRRLTSTTGTITTNLKDENVMHDSYVRALFYFFNDCNPDRIGYMLYDALKDVQSNAKAFIDCEGKAALNRPYVKAIVEAIDRFDLDANDLIVGDEALYSLINEIRELRK